MLLRHEHEVPVQNGNVKTLQDRFVSLQIGCDPFLRKYRDDSGM
ncbi:MAG: hypothetical protein ABR986_07295 [Methanomassiliicoccales archaeon]